MHPKKKKERRDKVKYGNANNEMSTMKYQRQYLFFSAEHSIFPCKARSEKFNEHHIQSSSGGTMNTPFFPPRKTIKRRKREFETGHVKWESDGLGLGDCEIDNRLLSDQLRTVVMAEHCEGRRAPSGAGIRGVRGKGGELSAPTFFFFIIKITLYLLQNQKNKN